MKTDYFTLTSDHLAQHVWPKRWLALAVTSLALAGVFSIILVISRTPQLIEAIPAMKELFGVSLVVHVDLSVLVWFLTMTSFLWSIYRAKLSQASWPLFEATSWWSMLIGMLLIAASPLSGEWEVIKSNYIPVITNQLFFVGLALVMCSLVISLLQTLPLLPKSQDGNGTIWYGVYWSAPITAIALIAFVASYTLLPEQGFEGLSFYENVFWAGGHILQFTYTQSMLVAWVLIISILGIKAPSERILGMLLILGFLVVLSSFVPYIAYDITSQEHMDFFTEQMWMGAGAAGGLLGLYILFQWVSKATDTPHLAAVRGCMAMSLMLYFVGGSFGVAIDGPNVRIPAHYHGSIVAVTLALMGMAYALLPSLGYVDVARWRMARWQPYLYGFGQLLHVSGLAWSGGYGVLRKTAGNVGDGSWQVKAALGMMGGGGLLAIFGGLFFVIVLIKALQRPLGTHIKSR